MKIWGIWRKNLGACKVYFTKFFLQHNYLTPILNSQYLSGINYLNAVAASSKNSSQSTPPTQSAPSTEKSALLEKLSTSLNQSLVSDGISSP